MPDILNFRQGMVYVIDHFLHFMAIHGYELRKIRSKKVPRKDLDKTIEEKKEADFARMKQEVDEVLRRNHERR